MLAYSQPFCIFAAQKELMQALFFKYRYAIYHITH